MPLNPRNKFYLWLIQIIVLAMIGFYVLLFKPLNINADITSLFPKTKPDHWQQIQDKITQDLNQKLLYLVGHSNSAQAKHYSLALSHQLEQIAGIKNVTFVLPELPNPADIAAIYANHRYQLLTDQYREILSSHNEEAIFEHQFKLLNQLVSVLPNELQAQDNLLTLSDFVTRSPFLESRLEVVDNQYLALTYEGVTYFLILADLESAALDVDNAIALVSQLNQVVTPAGFKVLRTGAVFYSAKASEDAKKEMTLLGSISVVATLLLIYFTFKSSVAIVATTSVIAIAAFWGLIALAFSFSQINVLAFVFALTLIGIVADYCFHALTELQNVKKVSNSPLKGIKRSILLSFITTSIGYGLLAMSPFQVFTQVAIFTIAGLLAAMINVWLLFPFFHQHLLSRQQATPVLYKSWWRIHQLIVNGIQKRWPILVVILLLLAAGLNLFRFEDNPRLFYQASQTIVEQEQQVKKLLGNKTENQFVLVKGDNLEQLLQSEEKVVHYLRQAQKNEILDAFSSLSQWLPSEQQQLENLHLLKQVVNEGRMSLLSEVLEISPELIVWQQPINATLWLESPIGRLFKSQYLQAKSQHYSVIKLGGIRNLARFKAEFPQDQQFVLVDPVGDASASLSHFRALLLWVFAAAFIATLSIFIFRYGIKQSLIAASIPLISFAIALSLSFLIQDYLTLFNLVAGLVIFALGLDYAIFYAEHGFKTKISQTTLLSALSSIFVFAMLAFSATPAIASFGQTVFIGILVTFLLSPLVTTIKSTR